MHMSVAAGRAIASLLGVSLLVSEPQPQARQFYNWLLGLGVGAIKLKNSWTSKHVKDRENYTGCSVMVVVYLAVFI